jgi:hypothetical protein
MARLAVMALLAISLFLPGRAAAADADIWRGDAGISPVLSAAASSPLDAQILGEKPTPPSSKLNLLHRSLGLPTGSRSGATLNLTPNLQMNVSFLYNHNSALLDPGRHRDTLPLFKYSMDYHLLPNFEVGLSGYLYYPSGDQRFTFNRSFGDRVMGLGPGIKYDLGRWSFIIKSQIETGDRDRGDDFQNWLRVWYAF